MIKTILICLDGSKLAEQILPYATQQALCFHSKIILLQVIPEPFTVIPGTPIATPIPVTSDNLIKKSFKEQNEAIKYLEKIATSLRECGIEVEIVTFIGHTGEIVVNYAHQNNIDLIALATHGRSGLGRAIFGSVADYVLKSSNTPILLIKPKELKEVKEPECNT